MRKRSIARRIFQIVLIGNLLVLVVVMGAAWLSLESLEQALIDSEKQAELSHFQKYGDKTRVVRLKTAQMVSLFVPNAIKGSLELPVIFEDLPVPYEGEKKSMGEEFLVLSYALPEGDYYVAKSLEQFEIQEEKMISFILILVLLLVVLSFLLALMASRIIARPIEKISRDIQQLDAGEMDVRMQQTFADEELNTIAGAINEQFNKIEEVFKRERALTAMASHELRTPIAVIMGAANVIESRHQLKENDQITLNRIITTAANMTNTLQALLNLVRRTRGERVSELVRLRNLLEQIRQDYELHDGKNTDRLSIQFSDYNVEIYTDPVLLQLLLQNIINNALDHAIGKVIITLDKTFIQIEDEGSVNKDIAVSESLQSTGLGLYIVSLICSHLKWHYEINSDKKAGTCVTLFFTSE